MGKTVLCFFSFFLSCAFSDVAIVLDTHSSFWGITTYANYTYRGNDRDLHHWQLLHHKLKNRGEDLFVTNLEPFEMAKVNSSVVSAIIFNNIPRWIGKKWGGQDWKKIVASLRPRKILICWEPPSVIREQYDPEILKLFDLVLTWNPTFVDNKKFFSFQYPDWVPMASSLTPFSSRRLLTQICGNKRSSHPDELYSSRKQAILYFERRPEMDFQFFGKGWEKERLRVYGGSVGDKSAVLQKFKFSLCFENIKNTPGYVTEKIFDCMAAGCVPVYWGAPDIEKYIPQTCFIRCEKFRSFSQLYRYLANMPEKRYLEYVAEMRKFLSSDRAKLFTRPALVARVEKALAIVKKAHPTAKNS